MTKVELRHSGGLDNTDNQGGQTKGTGVVAYNYI